MRCRARPRGVGMSSAEGPQDLGESPSRDGTTKKRPRSSPTLLTPRRNEKRIPLRVLVARDNVLRVLVAISMSKYWWLVAQG